MSANLVDLNDGMSFTGNAEGQATSNDIAEALLFSDFQLMMQNNSAITSYQLTFQIDYQLFVEAQGLDATTLASLQLFDTSLPNDFLIDETILSDTLSSPSSVSTGSITQFFQVIIDPLSTVTWEGEVSIDGLAFEIGDRYNVMNSLEISLANIRALTINIPEPNAFILLLCGIYSLLLFRKTSNSITLMPRFSPKKCIR